MNDDHWPDCAVPGCGYKVCRALDSDRCYIHTPGSAHVKDMKIRAANADQPEASDDDEPDVEYLT